MGTAIGRTVILGGYILETANRGSQTVIKVLQAPLDLSEAPESKDASEGRFIVLHPGFLDPAVYSKERAITVAGTVLGTLFENIGQTRLQYLQIRDREIYLWPPYEKQRPYYYGYPPYPYDWRWAPYPYYPY